MTDEAITRVRENNLAQVNGLFHFSLKHKKATYSSAVFCLLCYCPPSVPDGFLNMGRGFLIYALMWSPWSTCPCHVVSGGMVDLVEQLVRSSQYMQIPPTWGTLVTKHLVWTLIWGSPTGLDRCTSSDPKNSGNNINLLAWLFIKRISEGKYFDHWKDYKSPG